MHRAENINLSSQAERLLERSAFLTAEELERATQLFNIFFEIDQRLEKQKSQLKQSDENKRNSNNPDQA
jgi:hypothetical protein